MNTEIISTSILNVAVSCVPNYYTKDRIRPVNLLTWLCSAKYAGRIRQIRATADATTRNKLKAELPAITPCGRFSSINEQGLIEHSGFLQFDIDKKDNPNIADYNRLKMQLAKIKNIAYCGLSASGQGWWGLVPIAYPDMHAHHWQYLAKALQHYGIKIDAAPKNICSLRGYSYDPDGYFNHQAPLLVNYIRTQVPVAPTPEVSNDNQQRIKDMITQLVAARKDITEGYNNWYAIGCCIAANFGEGGRVLFHNISQFHKSYNYDKVNAQYEHCKKSAKDAGIGIIVKRWKEALP
ncbi:MAG: PriCT-2 domain-containing protein [Chitinophagales bacterium]|nr:PriCT-2 domain-containing protein [Chitinophagales bacterium]